MTAKALTMKEAIGQIEGTFRGEWPNAKAHGSTERNHQAVERDPVTSRPTKFDIVETRTVIIREGPGMANVITIVGGPGISWEAVVEEATNVYPRKVAERAARIREAQQQAVADGRRRSMRENAEALLDAVVAYRNAVANGIDSDPEVWRRAAEITDKVKANLRPDLWQEAEVRLGEALAAARENLPLSTRVGSS